MASPVHYILVSLIFSSLTLSVLFFIVWKTLGEKPYALSWSVGFFAAACQWLTNLNAPQFPNFESYWLLVNALALVLITLGLRGHCQRTNCQVLPSNLLPHATVVFATIVWFTIGAPHVGLRTMIVPATAAVTLLIAARLTIQHREITRPAEWAAAVSMIVFALTQGIAAVMAFMQGPDGNAAYQAMYTHFNFLTLPAGYMAVGMFVILMLASDISIDMKDIAVHDQLTGALNRRGLGEQGAAAYATSNRTGVPVSVIMTDIDRFKNINDRYGHAVGDTALRHFSDVLREARRGDDILARVGGEEFALVLPGTNLKEAMAIADFLCEKVSRSPMMIDGQAEQMTASFGVASISANDTCLSDTIARADQALYRSKRAGRNQVDLESSQLMLNSDGTLKTIAN